ncbi:chemotaxis protein [Desulforamulus ruminis]|uniref:chemotaxis protein n=1 Tax=Desulforamulus ruminis TaxID=1564 RepID=UPI002357C667|nr:chemotaxis protein [Desulforamulus ruminis]
MQVLEFVIAGNHFGINVAKVRELVRYQEVQRIPHSQPSVEGIVWSRDEIFTVVDLAKFMDFPASEDPSRDILIITDFNQMSVAFHVHKVDSIRRISWETVEKPSPAIYGDREGIVTGIAKLSDRIIALIDFEKIMYEITPSSSVGAHADEAEENPGHSNSLKPILIAEDSPMLNKMITDVLHKAGYQNIIKTSNGQEAWDYLQGVKDKPGSVACVITDIEMPRMDGHHLTKRIKEDRDLSKIPVVIFSSLITDVTMLKGKEVGADAQLSKPEIGQLVQTINRIISVMKKRGEIESLC